MNTLDRFLGCLLGLACGDAVGTRVEFMPRGSFEPVTGMHGGGPFELEPGQWTDDTSMALCLGASLLHRHGFDARDQMNRYCNWRSVGYMSSNGHCFDIGLTVAAALDRYLVSGNPFSGSPNPRAAGNGALMRLAPVPMFYAADAQASWRYAGESTRTTHGAQEAIDCSRLFAHQLRLALYGSSREAILRPDWLDFEPSFGPNFADSLPPDSRVHALAQGLYLDKTVGQISGSGYCVESLEAALWCFAHSTSLEESILRAANLGDDADTTAAICGQLAGAHYGASAIPKAWLDCLTMRAEITKMAAALYEASGLQ